jgi:3-oxoacyl-[acyl-carrier-protein] synthase II
MSSIVATGMGACTNQATNASALWQHVLGTALTEQYKLPLGLPAGRQGHPTEQPSASFGPSLFQQALNTVQSATQEAIKVASLDLSSDRIGCTISASKPFFEADGSVLPPDFINDALSEHFQIKGERRNIVAACATGAYAVALGASWIEQGVCDVVLAGSVEPPAHPLVKAGFEQMGVVTGESAMRPFDLHRSGFVLGSGAGVVVLESEAHAQARGVTSIARLTGWGWGADGHSAVAFNSNGERIAQVIRQALRRGHLPPDAISHVNAHGTATRLNDWIETQALLKAFGSHAEKLLISATKSSTGHLLGAAGSVELVLTLKALQEQFIPPTLHLKTADPECALNYTPGQGHGASFEHALSLSFGFGGPIGALIVSRN